MRRYFPCLLALPLFLFFISHVNASVSPEMQKVVRANTFEVVMKKPETDTAKYEKPLPLELVPFHERNDAYMSIGTAFALGHNTYVTAAHVFRLAINSQYGNPELRGADNTVYAIDRILRFSQHEDYVVFSLLHDPSPVGFAVNRDPRVDELVFAVGNALGEGIVIRDGLYTSATEEEQDGQWKWIRFSAAASPGNSGGPLLDDVGDVIGIVIGKSPSENLNYSLPIGRALVVEEHSAKFNQRDLTALPFLHGTYAHTYQDGFNLPLTWSAFVDAYQSLIARHNDEARAALLKSNNESLFPRGPGSDSLLFDPDPNDFQPFMIAQQDDGAWGANKPEYAKTELPGDGSVAVASAAGATLLRLIRPDRATDDAFYGDSKAFMDLALKALNVRRQVGQDQVRITSLGPAKTDTVFTDQYKRTWQERLWAVPMLDIYIVAELLPTPDGYVALISYVPSPYVREGLDRLRLLTGQLGVSLRGSLNQWQRYLLRRPMLPAALSEIKLSASPEWKLQSPRITAAVPTSVLALTDDSVLALTMGFTVSGGSAAWEVDDLWWYKDERMDAAVGLWRRLRPPKAAKIELRNTFVSMRDRRAPFDGNINRDTAETYSMTRILEVPGKSPGSTSADLLYGLTVRMVGYPTVAGADRTLQSAIESSRILEHGVGEDIAGAMNVNSDPANAVERSWQQMIAGAEQNDSSIGKDIRGRTMSQDLREFYAAYKEQAKPLPGGTRAAADADPQHMPRFLYLVEYWKNYPALSHNRDMWNTFLSQNGMAHDTPHSTSVLTAEASLIAALNGGAPTAEWSERANALRIAYIEERVHLVRSRQTADDEFRKRVAPCGAPAGRTTGKRVPSYAHMNRSLEDFWPIESKRLGEEGTVMVNVRISPTGCAMAAAIAGSSGSEMLDEAVLKFYETIDFLPGEIDGKAIESTVGMPVVFKLTN